VLRASIVAAVGVLAVAAPAAAAEEADWLAYGHDAQLTNRVASSKLTVAAASRFRLEWARHLDGAVVASPLATRVTVRGRSTQVVFVTTEAGSVYAISAATAEVVWHRAFGAVVTQQCGEYGFSSTGAIDAARGVLYVIGAQGDLHALDLETGEEEAGWPVHLIERNGYEYVWGGLRLVGRRLYVPVASYCDETDPQGVAADGRLMVVDSATGATAGAFDSVPGFGNLGGIWGWGGVSAEEDGTVVYTAVGNSRVFSTDCACFVDDAGYGNSIVALSPDLATVVASDQPTQVPNTGDNDFGAAPMLFQPRGCPPLAAANNKVGALFIWDRTRLAHGPYARFELSDARAAFVGAPSYDPVRQTFFDSEAIVGEGPAYGVVAFQAGPECSLHPIWKSAAGAGNQPPPLVVGDVVFVPLGRLGGFAALSAVNGRRLWSFATRSQAISPMISVGGSVLAGDRFGNFFAFGTGSGATVRGRAE
jgi:outer membrane protein assembly factor BamB